MKFQISYSSFVVKTAIYCLVLFSAFAPFFSLAQNPTVISDSLVIMQRVHAKEELIVDQDALFKGEVHVIGESRFETDVRFDEGIKVEGTAKLNGVVKMENLESVNLTESSEILIILPNGQVKAAGIGPLTSMIYYPLICSGGDVPNPVWANGLNKIYVECDPVNVGIGTSGPAHKLHVVGVNYAKNFLAGNSDGPTNALLNAYSPNDVQKLIEVGIKFGGLPEDVRFTVFNSGAISSKNVGSAPSLTVRNGTGHAAVFYSNNGTKIFQLEDDGLLRTRQVRVDAASWADFVFDKNYELPKLKDVARFIEKNKHLPGIPSSKEIQKNGIDVAEMQTLQMQKIEELTLYMIEMDQKMEEMQSEILSLKKENKELKKLQRN